MGLTDILSPEESFVRLAVESIVSHPSYNTPPKANDIGLVRVASDIEFNPNIMSACEPTLELTEGTVCLVSGWGNTACKYIQITTRTVSIFLNVLYYSYLM